MPSDKKSAYPRKDVFTETPAGNLREAGAGFLKSMTGTSEPKAAPSARPAQETAGEPDERKKRWNLRQRAEAAKQKYLKEHPEAAGDY